MIEMILPSNVVAVDTRGDSLDTVLFPDELASLGAPVEKRRREFTTARACARRALARLGRPAVAIPTGPHGEPRWPEGVVGSITHCTGYRACALARSSDVAAIGIDAEPHAALPEGVLDQVALADEHNWVRAQTLARPAVHWDRLIFSAKESVYKAWFPLAEHRPEFHDALITLAFEPERFHVELLAPGPVLAGRQLGSLCGRWLIGDGLILTTVVIASLEPPQADALASAA